MMRAERDRTAGVAVTSLGRTAARALARSRQWRVISRYDRCFYCGEDSGAILCVAVAELGRGPFLLSCAAGAEKFFPLAAGCDRFEMDGTALVAAGESLRFDLGGASVWEGEVRRFSPPATGLEEDLSWLAGRAATSASVRGWGRLIPQLVGGDRGEACRGGRIEGVLERVLLDVCAEVGTDFCSHPQGRLSERSVSLLESLVGVGLGLTPSGDDFLAGFLLGMFRAGLAGEAQRLAGRLYRKAAAGRTTAVSVAFYRALLEGSVSEVQHDFIAAFGLADRCGRTARLQRLENFGATSGWDMLAGFVLALDLWRRTAGVAAELLAEACG